MAKALKIPRLSATPPQRRFLPRRQQRPYRALLAVATGAISLIVGVLLIGLGREWMIKPAEPVAQITLTDGRVVEISSGAFQQRIHWERARYRALAAREPGLATQLADSSGFGLMVLEQMAREVLVREAAAQRRLAVGEEDVNRYLEHARQTELFSPTEAEAKEWRELVRAQLFEEQLRAAMAQANEPPFEQWLASQQARVLKLDRWRERVPAEPAGP